MGPALILVLLLQGFLVSAVGAVSVIAEEACYRNVYTTPKPTGAQLNDTCSKNADCYQGRGPVVCTDGICKCSPDYYPSQSYDINRMPVFGCLLKPGFGQECTNECRWPFQCVESSTPPPVMAYMYYGYTSTPRSNTVKKFCLCMAPYKMYDSVNCVLQCAADEIAGRDTCYKRCGENEVQLANFECKPTAGLGAACEVDQQCIAPFSECANKQCACRSGFRADGGTCVIAAGHCDYGEALRPAGSGSDAAPVTCTKTTGFSGNTYSVDRYALGASTISTSSYNSQPTFPVPNGNDAACPADHYCQAYDLRSDKVTGICCPYPKPICPVGEPHPTGNCSDSYMYATTGPSGPTAPPTGSCPTDTHYCYVRQTMSSSSYSAVTYTCCPRACPRGFILVNNQCLPAAQLGDKCQANEQCSSVYADCINGVCACPPKTTAAQQSSNAGKICVAQSCDYYTETAINNRCYPRLKIGDQCKGQESRCPNSALCNSAGVCQCRCGTVGLNNAICVSVLSCPPVRRSSPATGPYPTTPNVKDVAEKAVFCRAPDGPAATLFPDAAETCPDGQFCYPVASSLLGVCCDKLEPSCPYNNMTYDKCEPTTYSGYSTNVPAQSCPDGQFCYQYYSPLTSTADSGVCCDKYVPRTTPRPYQYTTGGPIYAAAAPTPSG